MKLEELVISPNRIAVKDGNIAVKVEPIGRPFLIRGTIKEVDEALLRKETYESTLDAVADGLGFILPQNVGYVVGEQHMEPSLGMSYLGEAVTKDIKVVAVQFYNILGIHI